MTTPADELRAAATKLRDLAARTTTTLERHDVQWTDLTVSDTEANAKGRPMVWSQYAATMHPGVGALLAELLETAADYVAEDAAAHPTHLVRAFAVARAILGSQP